MFFRQKKLLKESLSNQVIFQITSLKNPRFLLFILVARLSRYIKRKNTCLLY